MSAGPNQAVFALHGEGLPSDIRVIAYEAIEGLSRLFETSVDFCTADGNFDLQAQLRQRLLLEVVNERGESRYFDGIVERAQFVSIVANMFHFRVVLVPALSLLQYREDSRIFQELSTPDIVKQLLNEANLTDKTQWELTISYPPREYVVQYRESTFNFISRLLEDEGIFYFFAHTSDGHKLILADNASAFDSHDSHFPDHPPVEMAIGAQVFGQAEPLREFARKKSLRATSAQLRDFEFKTPQVKPEGFLTAEDARPMPYYEYPGGFSRGSEGGRRATARLSSLRNDSETARGKSSAIGLCCGGLFIVDGAVEQELNAKYVVVTLSSQGRQEQDNAKENFACRNEITAIPQGVTFAPALLARRPKITGLQTAVVTGSEADDQSIHVDEFGRIKVRFYWDRYAQYDDKSSCWMRVNQVPMGGSMILPRVGWEMTVAFLDGNPDCPLVVGRVYNAENGPPMALPAGKASGSIKSMSSPGAAGCNELTMGDSGGSQGFGIKAQKDLNMVTGFDSTTDITVDDKHHINANYSRSIGINDSASIGANQSLNVGASLTTNVGANQSVDVGGNDTSNSTANFLEKITGNRSYEVGGNQMTVSNGVQRNVDGNFSRTVGAVELVVAADDISDNIAGNSTTNIGAVCVHLVKGTHSEVVGGARTQTAAAAELHLIKGNYSVECKSAASTMVGAVSMQKITGDYTVKAPVIALVGAVGGFKGGGSELKLSGGPITLKGSKLSFKGALIKKMGASLKQG